MLILLAYCSLLYYIKLNNFPIFSFYYLILALLVMGIW